MLSMQRIDDDAVVAGEAGIARQRDVRHRADAEHQEVERDGAVPSTLTPMAGRPSVSNRAGRRRRAELDAGARCLRAGARRSPANWCARAAAALPRRRGPILPSVRALAASSSPMKPPPMTRNDAACRERARSSGRRRSCAAIATFRAMSAAAAGARARRWRARACRSRWLLAPGRSATHAARRGRSPARGVESLQRRCRRLRKPTRSRSAVQHRGRVLRIASSTTAGAGTAGAARR